MQQRNQSNTVDTNISNSQISQSQLQSRNIKSLDSSKRKYPHTSIKQIFSATILIKGDVYLFVQCQQSEVIVCETWGQFEVIWRGKIKGKVSCVFYEPTTNRIYVGTNKVEKKSNEQDTKDEIQAETTKCCQLIPSIDGQTIISIFSIKAIQNQLHTYTITNSGTMRQYKSNKYVRTLKIPYKIDIALSNKSIANILDVGFIMFKELGTAPYILIVEFIISMFDLTQQQVEGIFANFDKQLANQSDQLIHTSQITSVVLSNNKRVLCVATGNILTVYRLKKKADLVYLVPNFKFKQEESISCMDLIGTGLIYLSNRGISTIDVQIRKKIAKGLVFKGPEYDIVHWVQVPSLIIYGSMKASKMKANFCELRPPGQ